MSNARIAKLNASTSLGKGIECVQISISINSSATATLQMGVDTGGVVIEPLASEILDEIRSHQQKRLGGVAKPDVSVFVDDDIHGTFNMTGFLASPVLEISKGNIGYQANILDKASILDGLDLSIYNQAVDTKRQKETPEDLPKPTGDVCKLLLDITNMLVGKYDAAYSAEFDPVKKKIIKMRHELNNSGPLQAWTEILQKSNVQHNSWSELISNHKNAGRHISEKIVTMLCMKSSGFWNVVNQLMSAFQMFYRPDPNGGSYGEFVNNKEKIDQSSGSLELDIVNLNVRDGSARILQVGGVIMEAGSAPAMRSDETPGVATPACAGHFPEEIKHGYIHNEIPPIWLVDASGVCLMGSEKDQKKETPPTNDSPNLDLDSYVSRRDEGVKHIEKTETARGGVMSELCEYMFKDLQLADSVISARIPLNLTVKVGVRQSIRMGNAGSVSGFVSGVIHRIDLRQGRELDSFSQVTITHVKY
jgi:hypothetical protein